MRKTKWVGIIVQVLSGYHGCREADLKCGSVAQSQFLTFTTLAIMWVEFEIGVEFAYAGRLANLPIVDVSRRISS